MKTKLITAITLFIITSTSFAATKQTNTTAVVDMQSLASSKVCTDMIDTLKTEYRPQLEKIQKEAQIIGLQSKEKKDEAKKEELAKQYQKIQKEAQEKAQTVQINCINVIRDAAKIVAEKDGYSIILPKIGALYVNQSNDITSQVLKQLNEGKK